MKKGITKILSACVFAFVVFLAAGTQSKAAVNMGKADWCRKQLREFGMGCPAWSRTLPYTV